MAPRAAPAPAVAATLSQDDLKRQAAHQAVDYVKSGMKLGLGTGSTAAFAVARIGELLKRCMVGGEGEGREGGRGGERDGKRESGGSSGLSG